MTIENFVIDTITTVTVHCDLTTNQYFPGWGKIKHPGGSHDILQQAQMPPVTKAACQKKLASSPGKLYLL